MSLTWQHTGAVLPAVLAAGNPSVEKSTSENPLPGLQLLEAKDPSGKWIWLGAVALNPTRKGWDGMEEVRNSLAILADGRDIEIRTFPQGEKIELPKEPDRGLRLTRKALCVADAKNLALPPAAQDQGMLRALRAAQESERRARAAEKK